MKTKEMKHTKKTWRVTDPDFQHGIEVSLHDEGGEYTPGRQGIYCYYLYLYEKKMSPEQFEKLWLEDRIKKWSTEGSEHIVHDYWKLPILEEVDFAGGCTFYDKRGHTPGHRCVVLGADFNHSWDMENPPYSVEYIIGKAKQTADQVTAYLARTTTPTQEGGL